MFLCRAACNSWCGLGGIAWNSPTLRVTCRSKKQGFLLGGRQISALCLRGPLSGGIQEEVSGSKCLKPQPRVKIMA